jgi:protoporphyrin/coproporphyrin ferrochelatase
VTDDIGVLVMSYGTARDLDDVLAYYTHIRHGRPPSPEALAGLKARYAAIGGRSPLAKITEAQVRGLERELNRSKGARFRAFNGQKHQVPYIEDAVEEMAREGLARAVGIVLAPHYSRLSVGEYVGRAKESAGSFSIEMSFVRSYHVHPGFVRFVAGGLEEARDELPPDVRDDAWVVFSAHSLPARILSEGDPYLEQLRETAQTVGAALGLDRFRIAWQSAGRTEEEWLGPDVSDVLRELAAAGARAVVSCPVGFVSDHLEVLYDIDIEAQAAARESGLALVRTRSPNDDPEFLRVLATVIREHLGEEAM